MGGGINLRGRVGEVGKREGGGREEGREKERRR